MYQFTLLPVVSSPFHYWVLDLFIFRKFVVEKEYLFNFLFLHFKNIFLKKIYLFILESKREWGGGMEGEEERENLRQNPP